MTAATQTLQVALVYFRSLGVVWAGVFGLFLICRVTFWKSDIEVGFYAPILFWGLSFGSAVASIRLGWKQAVAVFSGIVLAGIALAYSLHGVSFGLRLVGILP